MRKKIVIIGAGSIGLTSAYYLLQEGYDITILERNNRPEGCSYGNAGMIVPSHFVPLAAPGVVMKGIKWMLSPESPFHITPSFDPVLISWLWRFYRSSTHRHVTNSMNLLSRLNIESRNLFEQFSQKFETGFMKAGMLMLANSMKGLMEETKLVKLAPKAGITAEVLSVNEISKLQPGIQLNIVGGIYFQQDASINPGLYLSELSGYLRANGVQILYDAGVTNFIIENKVIRSIITETGRYSTDEVILAAGAWSSDVIKKLGISLSVIAGKGYSITLDNPVKQLSVPAMLSEARVAITPMGKMLRFAGTMELTGNNLSIAKKRVAGMVKNISSYLPDFQNNQFSGQNIWVGLRPVSSDGLPFIGRFAKFRNLIAATGHSMMGISLSPITGKLVEEIVSGKPPTIDISKLSPARLKQ